VPPGAVAAEQQHWSRKINMELRHIQSFCAVAEEKHVTRAAERLHIAQPALTQQLRLLEKELGLALVQRSGRGIALTEAGEFFHKEAALILQHLSRACEQTREVAHGETSHLRVGVTEAVAYSSTLAKVLSCFQEQWPAVRVTLSQNAASELGPALREHQIDVAFTCPIHTSHLNLISQRLAQDRMMLAVPALHPLAGRKSVSLPDLKDKPLVLVAHDRLAGTFEEMLDAACERHGFAPRIVQTSPRLMLALNLAAAGAGFAFVPDYMSSVSVEGLRYVPIEDSSPLMLGIDFIARAEDNSLLVTGLREIALRLFKDR